jgi:hypothetical protein
MFNEKWDTKPLQLQRLNLLSSRQFQHSFKRDKLAYDNSISYTDNDWIL